MKRSNIVTWILILTIGIAVGAGGFALYNQASIKQQTASREDKITKSLNNTGRKSEKTINKKRANARFYKNQTKKTTDNSADSAFNQNVAPQLSGEQQLYIRSLLDHNQFTGTMLIVQNDKVIWQTGVGYANYAKKEENTAQSVYQIGSIQKSYTAVLFDQQLIVPGIVKYSDPISKYYPSIPEGNKIPIRNMLDMKSGIFHNELPPKVMTNKEVVEYSVNHLHVKKRGQWAYQPINFTLLTGILESETHQYYSDLLEKHILDPLKLERTGFMPSFNKEPHQTLSYKAKGKNLYAKRYHESDTEEHRELGTGNVYSTAGDLFRAERGFIQGKIVSKKALGQLRDSDDGSYAGGVYNYPQVVQSHGIEAGYDAGIVISKHGHNGVVLLANRYPKSTTVLMASEIYKFLDL